MSRVERIILCGGVPPPPRARRENVLRLRLGDADDEIRLKISDITNRLACELPDVLTDLVEVATYVYCADQAVTRGGDGVIVFGQNWRRRFSFHVPVRALEVWSSDAVCTVLRSTLGFLSDDDYEFHFHKHRSPVPMQTYLELMPGAEGINEIDEVLPFSGGADSLAGATIEAARDGRRIVLVSHRANPKISSKQKLLVEDLRRRCPGNKPIHIPVWVQKGVTLDREYTQRTRSFLYAVLAAVVAVAFGLRRIRFYENGVVSLNLPISEQVVGGRATRTTHPQVLSGYASLFQLLLDGAFDVENCFLWLTKSEVIDLIGDAGCAELIKHSVSCMHTRDMTQIFTHCGNCSQCVIRRFATLAGKYADSDPAEMYRVDLLIGEHEKNADLTLVESYIRIAAEMRTMNEYQLLERFGEMSRILLHVQGLTADQAAERIVRLHQKHAEEINRVLRGALSSYSAQVLDQELPRTCAIILAFPGKYRMAGVDGGGQDRQQSAEGVRKTQRQVYRFDTPSGTKWRDILIRFLDGHTVTISINSRAERRTFAEMNMKDGRNGNPTHQWKLLELLARSGGRLSWQDSTTGSRAKKQIELLGRRLREYFGIDESPFHDYKKGSGWQIKLRLEAPR